VLNGHPLDVQHRLGSGKLCFPLLYIISGDITIPFCR
jgi:hypothetical protein